MRRKLDVDDIYIGKHARVLSGSAKQGRLV